MASAKSEQLCEVLRLQQHLKIFACFWTQLCVCMMNNSDNRVITVSHLIPSHS